MLVTGRGCKRRRVMLNVAILAALFVSAEAAKAGTLDSIRADKTVRIGYIADQAPFASKTGDANPKGYAIDICNRVADALSPKASPLKRDYVETTLADAFQAVASDRIDLLCGAVTISLKRRETVDFSQPIFLTGASALLRANSPDDLQTLFLDKPAVRPASAQPSRGVIGVRADTTTGATLRDALGTDAATAKIADFPTHMDGLKALEAHKIDAYFADRALLLGLLGRARKPSTLAIGHRLFTHEPYGIALKRDDPEFRLAVDRALSDFYLSDDFPKLLKAYFGSEGPVLRSEIMMLSTPP